MARNNTYSKKSYVKKSEASHVVNEKGEYIKGWNASKSRGFVTLIASPLSKDGAKKIAKQFGYKDYDTDVRATKSGKVYERWVCKLQNKTHWNTTTVRGFFHRATGKMYMPGVGLMVSTKGNYFGKIPKKK
jgi:hypothetical protein